MKIKFVILHFFKNQNVDKNNDLIHQTQKQRSKIKNFFFYNEKFKDSLSKIQLIYQIKQIR